MRARARRWARPRARTSRSWAGRRPSGASATSTSAPSAPSARTSGAAPAPRARPCCRRAPACAAAAGAPSGAAPALRARARLLAELRGGGGRHRRLTGRRRRELTAVRLPAGRGRQRETVRTHGGVVRGGAQVPVGGDPGVPRAHGARGGRGGAVAAERGRVPPGLRAALPARAPPAGPVSCPPGRVRGRGCLPAGLARLRVWLPASMHAGFEAGCGIGAAPSGAVCAQAKLDVWLVPGVPRALMERGAVRSGVCVPARPCQGRCAGLRVTGFSGS